MTLIHVLIVIFILCFGAPAVFFRWSKRVQRRIVRTKYPDAQPPTMSRKLRPLPLVQSAVGVPVEHLPNPYPPYAGTLRINDSLKDNSAGYYWMDDRMKSSQETEGCRFCDESYHVSIGNKRTSWMCYCLAYETNFSNFVYQIEATLLQGMDIGIVFRQTVQYGYYYFHIRRNGSYELIRASRATMQYTLLDAGFSPDINIELNQPNVLAVVANGPNMDLYVNQRHLTRVIDGACPAGRISTAAATADGSPCEASFRNVMLWTLDAPDDASAKESGN